MEARQEVLNTVLAQLLEQEGLIARPEQRTAQGKSPDVWLVLGGLTLLLEAEVDDQPDAAARAYHKAAERIEQGLCHLALALVYPAELRTLSLSALADALSTTSLRFALLRPPLPDQPDWRTGNLQTLADALRRAYELLVAEDEVQHAVDALKQGIDILAWAFYVTQVHEARFAEPLGINPKAIDRRKSEQTAAVRQIAALVVMNALLFHEELARAEPRVPRLDACFAQQSPHDALIEEWQRVLQTINYHAVFDLARSLLLNIPPHFMLDEALHKCLPIVRTLIRQRTLLRHDLAGRVYHLLLGDIAKPLGTYYTSVSSATLLLRLALAPERWALDWSDATAVGQFRLADLACGTGTLLMAALQALVDNYLRYATPDPDARKRLLAQLLEEGVWGLDVLQSAVHLTAATLAMPIPEVMVQGMRLYTAPLGMHNGAARLGSLDLLSDAPLTPQLSLYPELGQTARRATDALRQPEPVRLPPLDLVCMNPPFTRTCGDNLLFGSLAGNERTRLQRALQALLQAHGAEAHITAGLGAVFIAVADRHLKPNGRLAFVLPKALLSGVAWQPSRELLAQRYQMEYLIVSHDPERWNFSENTDLSETLFIARKRPETDIPAAGGDVTICVNLWRNTNNPVDAVLLSHEVRQLSPSGARREVFDLWMGDEKWGEAMAIPTEQFNALPQWLLPCAFAQSELVETLLTLISAHRLGDAPLPLCPLGELGALGPSRNDLWDAFDPVDNPPGFPAYWGRKSRETQTMSLQPNAHLVKIRQPRRPGRVLRNADSLAARASRLLIAERVWLNTLRTTAALFPTPVLSNVWLPLKLRDSDDERLYKAICLWWNSSAHLLLMLPYRVETRGAWSAFLRRAIVRMPVLDVRALSRRQVNALARAFDALSEQPLLPLSQMDADPVRAQIDAAVARALGLGDLSGLRAALAREPVISLTPLRQRRRR